MVVVSQDTPCQLEDQFVAACEMCARQPSRHMCDTHLVASTIPQTLCPVQKAYGRQR